MNGRIYDYNLGRFLSVDPFIQAPTNSQSMNPYSYIMNNPLAGTDPTGYASCQATRLGANGNAGDCLSITAGSDDGSTKPKEKTTEVVTVVITNGTQSELQAAADAVKKEMEKAGFKVADIGSQKQISHTKVVDSIGLKGTETACATICLLPTTGSSGLLTGGALNSGINSDTPENIGLASETGMREMAGSYAPTPPPDDDDKVNIRGSKGNDIKVTSDKIANGHAYIKHVIKQKEFEHMGINTTGKFSSHIQSVMRNASGSNLRNLSRGRTAYWDNKSGTVVIRDPASKDLGTAFRPIRGRKYFDNLN